MFGFEDRYLLVLLVFGRRIVDVDFRDPSREIRIFSRLETVGRKPIPVVRRRVDVQIVVLSRSHDAAVIREGILLGIVVDEAERPHVGLLLGDFVFAFNPRIRREIAREIRHDGVGLAERRSRSHDDRRHARSRRLHESPPIHEKLFVRNPVDLAATWFGSLCNCRFRFFRFHLNKTISGRYAVVSSRSKRTRRPQFTDVLPSWSRENDPIRIWQTETWIGVARHATPPRKMPLSDALLVLASVPPPNSVPLRDFSVGMSWTTRVVSISRA